MSIEVNNGAERAVHNGKILALIIRAQFVKEFGDTKEKFYYPTPEDFTFQFGIQNRVKNEIIEAHAHIPFTGIKKLPVQEFVYVIFGKIKVDLFDDIDNKVETVFLRSGDSIIFNSGHGLTILEDSKILNLKQGPYRGRLEEKKILKNKII